MFSFSKVRFCLCLLLILISTSLIFAQERGYPFHRNFTSKDYDGATQNWCIAQDSRGIMYVGNDDGVLQYDGNYWRRIPIANMSGIRSMGADKKGNIYIGAFNEFGLLKPNDFGRLEYQDLKPLLDSNYKEFMDVWSVISNKYGTYFFTENYIFHYRNGKINVIEPRGDYFFLAYKVDDQYILSEVGKGLEILIDDSVKMLPGGEVFTNAGAFSVLSYGDSIYYLGHPGYGLIEYDMNPDIVPSEPNKYFKMIHTSGTDYLKENNMYAGLNIDNQHFAYATTARGVVILNKQSEIVEVFHNDNILADEAVYNLYVPNDHNLFATLDNGLAYIEYGNKLRYWDNSTGFRGTILDIIRYKGQIYIATVHGVYKMNGQPDVKKDINTFSKIRGLLSQSWKLIEFKYQNITALLVGSDDGVFKIENDSAIRISDYTGGFTLFQSKKRPQLVYAGTRSHLNTFEFSNGVFNERIFNDSNLYYEIRSITEDTVGNLWLSANQIGVIQLSFIDSIHQFKLYDTLKGLPSLKEIKVFNYDDKLMFGTSEGLYDYNAELDSIIPDSIFSVQFSGKKPVVNSLLKDEKSGNYIMSGKYIFTQTHDGYKIDSTSLKRIPLKYTEASFIDTNGNIWLGGADGLYRIENENNTEIKDSMKIATLIRKVETGDSVIFDGYFFEKDSTPGKYQVISALSKQPKSFIPHLEFKSRSVSFEYALPYYVASDYNLFCYYLVGFDEDTKWSNWTNETKKEYTNLSEGVYTFYVKGKNVYETESQPAKFSFVIRPPWYRSWWAYLIYLALISLFISLLIRIRTRRLKLEKGKLEALVLDRTAEIQQQKEELESQAEWLQFANQNMLEQKHEIMFQAERLRKTNEELEKLSIIASETDNAVSVFDENGNIEWFNEGFTKLYGYNLKEFTNMKGSNIKSLSDDPKIESEIVHCLKNKQPVIYEFHTTSKYNEDIWVQTTLTPILDERGEPIKLIAIDSNITKLKKAEQEIVSQKVEIEKKSKELIRINLELEKLSLVASKTDNAVSIMDAKGNFEWINDGYEQMYGYTLNQLKSSKKNNISDIHANLNAKNIANLWFGDKKTLIYESKNTTLTGNSIWTQTTLTPIFDKDKNERKLVAIETDITLLKDAEQKIQQQRDELAKANATKDTFFSIIAHDLRGPFSSFLSLSSLMVENFNDFSSEEIVGYLGEMQTSSQKTFNLIENLLDWARTQKGEINYIPKYMDAVSMIKENIELLEKLARQKNIKLSCDLSKPVMVFGDENMIKTVFRNLISNAIKFTREKGEVKVVAEKKRNTWQFAIVDNGVGIAPENIDKLFRIDTRHSSLGTKSEKGTGLGLILCKDFVEKNGGKIWVKSDKEKGSTFYFTLPKM